METNSRVPHCPFPDKAAVIANTPDPASREMLEHLAQAGIPTVFDRFDGQKPHCGFGLAGNCCRICNMGPCRVTEAKKGACGADRDVVVARNLLRWVAAGVASHGARGREVILALREAAAGRIPFTIRGVDKVKAVAKAFSVYTEEKSVAAMAGEIADILLEDLSRAVPGLHRTIAAMAPPERVKVWSELDILPIGSYHEVFEALHRTGTGTDGDTDNLLKQVLRCGLAFAWNSVVGPSVAMDCLFGPPRRQRIKAGFGSIREDHVNIALHGHSPVLPAAVVDASRNPDLAAAAKQAGAAGIRLYGICCSGLSALYRFGEVHPLANAIGAELAMGTGALDAWVVDMQDVYPGISEVAACFHTKIVTTSDSCRLPGAVHMGLDHTHSNLGQADEIAERIVRLAIGQFSQRRGRNVFIPKVAIDADVGFSVENIAETFGGLPKLGDWLRDGAIRGIVNLVGCNNPKVLYERTITDFADALLANDILILTNGCASFPLLKLGYCRPEALEKAGPGLRRVLGPQALPPAWHMGECLDNARASALFRSLADIAGQPIKHMPFAFASPEWSNEKGVGAALGFRLMGVNSYHCVPAPVAGSEKVSRFFAEDTRALLGAVMVVEPEPDKLAAVLLADLQERRRDLGWNT